MIVMRGMLLALHTLKPTSTVTPPEPLRKLPFRLHDMMRIAGARPLNSSIFELCTTTSARQSVPFCAGRASYRRSGNSRAQVAYNLALVT
jgi:hypothetical protein